LPELLDAKTAGRIIYLAEGEKAVDALMSLGVVATTAHSGAGHWPEAITEYFAGANVVILPDNDLSGWSYARKATEAILPIAKALKVVDLGLQEQGDDAYEFIEAGGGRAELAALVKAAPKINSVDDVTIPERLQAITASCLKTDEIYTHQDSHVQKQAEIEHEFAPDPPKEAPKPTKTIKIESWDEIQDEPVEWLIEGVVPKGSFTALYGPPGSFKSFIALDIAEAIATGRTWMGREVKQTGAVLYLAGEGFGGIGARIKACKMHHQTEDGAPIYIVRHQLNL
jgi:DNA primase